MNNKKYEVRLKIITIKSNEPLFYLYSVNMNICSGSWNNINDRYAKLYGPDVVKHMNVRVFHLMSRTNETRYIEWHETYKRKRRLDRSVCNNKQRWNQDKCRCECKELIDKCICDEGLFPILAI